MSFLTVDVSELSSKVKHPFSFLSHKYFFNWVCGAKMTLSGWLGYHRYVFPSLF